MQRASVCLVIIVICLLAARISYGQAITSEDGKTAQQMLKDGLAEQNPDKRKEAVIALSLVGPRELAFSLLGTALDDKDVPVRVAACASLGDLKDNGSIPLLEKALKDDVPEVSFAAAKALYATNPDAARQIIIAVMEGEEKTNSGVITNEKRTMLRMLKTPGVLFKYAAKEGAGLLPIPGLGIGLASMQALLGDRTISGRAVAALLLAKDKDEDSFKALRSALSDKDWSVRAAAVHSIALRDRPEARADLVPLFDDKRREVRYRAAAAYLRLELLASDGKTGKSGGN